MRVSLLDFFRTASFGGVRVGFHRDRVESMLGKPDTFLPGLSESDDYRQAGLWVYAGVQFIFEDLDTGLLSGIDFRPCYLHMDGQYRRKTDNTELDAWIFGRRKDPTVVRLRRALGKEGITFQDTGLETCVFDRKKQRFVTIPYDPTLEDEEAFGTLVLRSGVQVRYSDDKSIIRVASSGDGWVVKGKEQYIEW